MSRAAFAGVKADRSRSSPPARIGLLERERVDGGLARVGGQPALEHRFGELSVHGAHAPVIQPKLRMNRPGDKDEREADRIAGDSVSAANKRTCHEMLILPPIRTSDVPQARAVGITAPVSPSTQFRIESLQCAGGEPLPEQVRAVVEPRLGHDLSDVRIHRNSVAHEVAEDLQARALTIGDHIIFNNGQYPAGNAANSRLLAHELVHSVQQKHGSHPLIQRAPLVINAGAPEEGLQSAPDEDLIEAGSDLDKRFHFLSRSIRQLLHDIFGEPKAPADEIWAALFPKAQFSEARRAAESYRAITNELSSRTLDVAFAAQWLEVAISTLNTLRTPLDEIANSGATQAWMAKTLGRQARRVLHAAMRLRKHQTIARGSALAATARAGVLKRLRREQKEAEERGRREQRPGLLELSQKGHVELLMLRLEAERSDPEFVETLNREMVITAAIEEGRMSTHETPLAALGDRLATLERVDRDEAARLITRMDQHDVTRLAENNLERVGRLGLRLAESTPSQTAIGLAGTLLPVIGSPLADIVSERLEEKEAIRDLANAVLLAGRSSKEIHVPDYEQLTHLRITRTSERIRFWKTDLLHSLERLDASRGGSSDIPQREWTFAPADLVTLTVVASGERVTRPAFAWLHAEDSGLEATYQEWTSLAQAGASAAKASAKKTGEAFRGQTFGHPPAAPRTRPAQRGASPTTSSAVAPSRAVGSPPPASRAAAAPTPTSVRATGAAERHAFPQPAGHVRGPRGLRQKYGDKLESENGALEDIYRRAGIWRRGESRRLATQWRGAASELAIIQRYLRRADVKKVTVVKATRGTKKAPGGAADITVEFTDGTRSPLEVTSATSAPVAKEIRKHESLTKLNVPEAKGLSALTTERAPTVESYMGALRRKAVTSVPWKKPRQIDIPKKGVEGPAIVSIHAPFGSASDLPMIEEAIGRLQSGISARVHTIEFSFGGTPGEALVFKRVGDNFVLQ
jgi:hypothetical protein